MINHPNRSKRGKDETVYLIWGEDAEGRKTVGARTSVIQPGASHDEIAAYLAGPYWRWLAEGYVTPETLLIAKKDWMAAVAASARFQILTKAEEITMYRKGRGLTQKQMAEQLGITREHLAAMETGRAPVTQRTLMQYHTKDAKLPAALDALYPA